MNDVSATAEHFVILPSEFYARSSERVAQDLLGKYLVLEESGKRKVGRITETEAYPGIGDKASHSDRGLSKRTSVLFGPAGTAYIYLIYGMYYCLNIVTDTPESGGAVLLRAVTPLAGLEGKTSGPGLLCKAYGIDKRFNGLPITGGPLTVQEKPNEPMPSFITLPRVGIDYAGKDKEKPYRFRIAS